MQKLIRIFFLISLVMAQPLAVSAADEAKLRIGSDGRFDFSAYKGKTIYLDFWASWCEPCRQSFGWMNQMHTKYSEDDLVIIAVNLDTDRKQAKEFLDKVPAKFKIAYDPKGISADAYGLKAMPSSFLIDRRGKLIYSHLGFKGGDKARLEAKIRQAANPSLASR